jgi:hypothetical protein
VSTFGKASCKLVILNRKEVEGASLTLMQRQGWQGDLGLPCRLHAMEELEDCRCVGGKLFSKENGRIFGFYFFFLSFFFFFQTKSQNKTRHNDGSEWG